MMITTTDMRGSCGYHLHRLIAQRWPSKYSGHYSFFHERDNTSQICCPVHITDWIFVWDWIFRWNLHICIMKKSSWYSWSSWWWFFDLTLLPWVMVHDNRGSRVTVNHGGSNLEGYLLPEALAQIYILIQYFIQYWIDILFNWMVKQLILIINYYTQRNTAAVNLIYRL